MYFCVNKMSLCETQTLKFLKRMRSSMLAFAAILPFLSLISPSVAADENVPIVPIGDDAYLMWDRLPYHRIGVRAYMRSTYDRTGGNRDADASHFLYQQADDFNVALDVAGPGVLYFVRTNHHHGSPWHYEIDGEDLIVKESATDNPVGANKRLNEQRFIPEELFPHPLTWTWPTTKGADLMWRPIPFADSFRLAYSRTFYGTGYYIYHQIRTGNASTCRGTRHRGTASRRTRACWNCCAARATTSPLKARA